MMKRNHWMLSVLFAIVAALMAGAAMGQAADLKGEHELTTRGQRIDTASASVDSGRVTDKIVEQWKGTLFTFDAASDPRELTAQDVQNLRQKRLGYGELSILLALAARQDPANARPFHEIVAMRKAGTGLGNLARELGYRNLGEVVRSVKVTAARVENLAARGRAERAEKSTTRPSRPEKLSRPEKPERPEKPAR